MAGNFCTQCGSPLEGEGLLFCTACGASLAESDDVDMGIGSLASSDMGPGYTVPAVIYQHGGSTAPQYVYQGAVPGAMAGQVAYGSAGGNAARDDSDSSIVKKGALIGIVVGLLIAAIVVFVVYRPLPGSSGGNGASGQVDVETTISETEPDSDAVREPDSDPESDPAPIADYYDDLMAYYDRMANYDSRIASCATYFNNNYTKSDYSVRQSGANDAASIHSDVNSDLSDLQALAISSDNPSYDDWQHMIELMTDLQHRIDVIDRAWQNSLSYSDPANHVDAIIAPLSADNVNGVNKYKTHFVDNYSSWEPKQRL